MDAEELLRKAREYREQAEGLLSSLPIGDDHRAAALKRADVWARLAHTAAVEAASAVAVKEYLRG